jgi:hypothetical protein
MEIRVCFSGVKEGVFYEKSSQGLQPPVYIRLFSFICFRSLWRSQRNQQYSVSSDQLLCTGNTITQCLGLWEFELS